MEGEAAHHLGRVLRAQPGQLYELSDGERVWLGQVETVGRDVVEFALVEELPGYQPSLDTALLLAVVKFDAFEWALEKATELGVTRIVPLAAARSEKALLVAAPKRAERWKKILLEASQQSRRVNVPCSSRWLSLNLRLPRRLKRCASCFRKRRKPSHSAWFSLVRSRKPLFSRLVRKAGGPTRSLLPRAARSFRTPRSAS